ncbi:MAG: hypothetical protein Q9219_002239 [cf. Caloplaca sp. 3 TL-2023]
MANPASKFLSSDEKRPLEEAPRNGSRSSIIRISGPACINIYYSLCPRDVFPKPRHATVRTLYHPLKSGEILDSEALIIFFPAPRTVTGEDVLELHVHGGIAVVKCILAAIPLSAADERGKPDARMIRYAEAGEFTRRAFYNNRLDLTQIEALGDTLSAETEQQRRIAVNGTSNILSQRYESWRQQLLYARGELEALIDFAEDQHFDESSAALVASVTEQVLRLRTQIEAAIDNASRGELLRKGISVAFLGAPNAGKSSLLNRIVDREAAIVSEEEGTTRDVIETGVDIGGFYCRFEDLAGLRGKTAASDVEINRVEQEGMRRAKERALIADVVVVLIPIERVTSEKADGHSRLEINSEVATTLKLCNPEKQSVLYVINKTDLVDTAEEIPHLQALLQQKISDQGLPPSPLPIIAISCATSRQQNDNPSVQQQFLKSLVGLFQDLTATSGLEAAAWESSLGATERQRLLLEQCSSDLRTYTEQSKQNSINPDSDGESVDVVLAAESLRSAADCLAKITGMGATANVEEVLGVVFENFLALISYLLCTITPLHAMPYATSSDNSQPVVPSQSEQQARHHHFLLPRTPPGTITASTLTHRTRLTQLLTFYPLTATIFSTLHLLYFQIHFNLSKHGKWYRLPPVSRVLIRQKELYILFYSSDPRVTLPWSFLRDWAEAMEMALEKGGFCGTYLASVQRIDGVTEADIWIRMGIGEPADLADAAAAARMKKRVGTER